VVGLLPARDNARLVHLLWAHLLLLLSHLYGNSHSLSWLIKLLGDLLGLLLVDLLLQFLEHLVLLSLVLLVVRYLVHNVVGLGHLHLNLLLVEHHVLQPLTSVASLFHELVGFSHNMCHIDVDRCHFQLVLLFHQNCLSSSEDLI